MISIERCDFRNDRCTDTAAKDARGENRQMFKSLEKLFERYQLYAASARTRLRSVGLTVMEDHRAQPTGTHYTVELHDIGMPARLE
jgi:hypothetical protein